MARPKAAVACTENNLALHGLNEIHVSTHSLKEAEGQQGTVSSPPGASVLIISLLQQELMAFVAFLIVGNPSVAAPQQQQKRRSQ